MKDSTQSTDTGVGSSGAPGYSAGQPTGQTGGFAYNPQGESALARDNVAGSGHQSGGHHLARDGAVGAGVGGAAYEAEGHHKHDKDLTASEREAKREHKHELKEEKREHYAAKEHHLGRDAAVAGGVGGAAYEADKHHNKHPGHDQQYNYNTSGTPSGVAPLGSSNIATDQQQSSLPDRSANQHHYGRDAAVSGGVGGAAYEADKHHTHDKDLTAAEKEQKKELKHEHKEEKREHKHEEKEEHKPSLLSRIIRKPSPSHSTKTLTNVRPRSQR